MSHLSDRPCTVLLILPGLREMYAMSTAALACAREAHLGVSEKYTGALILGPDGVVRSIERIAVVGPWGRSFARRLWSRFSGMWEIDTHLSGPLDVPLPELKKMVLACGRSDGAARKLGFDPGRMGVLLDLISIAPDPHAIFLALQLPGPEFAIDTL